MKIKKIVGRKIKDSRDKFTVEAEIFTEKNSFKASVPAGKSVGKHEAVSIDASKAINNIYKISKNLNGIDVTKQSYIDSLMIKLDGTKNKSNLGSNSILAVSLAIARAGAFAKKKELYNYLGGKNILPVPFANVINGGRHSNSNLKIQEFMIAPVKAKSFSDATYMISDVYSSLKNKLKKYGKIKNGDEGGFVVPLNKTEEVLNLILKAIDENGH